MTTDMVKKTTMRLESVTFLGGVADLNFYPLYDSGFKVVENIKLRVSKTLATQFVNSIDEEITVSFDLTKLVTRMK